MAHNERIGAAEHSGVPKVQTECHLLVGKRLPVDRRGHCQVEANGRFPVGCSRGAGRVYLAERHSLTKRSRSWIGIWTTRRVSTTTGRDHIHRSDHAFPPPVSSFR